MKYGKLKKTWQFSKVYQEGDKYYSNLFILYVLPNKICEIRVGLTVSKKVGKSVQRNRVKRLIREIVRSVKTFKPGYDLVFIARRSAVDIEYSKAKESIFYLLNRANILY
ncbi:ribonuclease P protein component [Candidatus Poribacteria bacterium]|nr:ribonuclease P protein component [Candidatus Poribacteria bacterium]